MRESRSDISTYILNLNASRTPAQSIQLRMPTDADIFRISLQATIAGRNAAIAAGQQMVFALITVGPPSDDVQGWRLYPKIWQNTAGGGNTSYFTPSDTLILDRTATDSKATDALYLTGFGAILTSGQILVVNAILEGYLK